MHFQKLARYNIQRLAGELRCHPELWDERPFRTFAGGPFANTSDIWVRYRAPEELNAPRDFMEPHFPVMYPAWHKLPSIQPIVQDLVHRCKATHLGGILITRVPAGGNIKPHHDRGSWHAEFHKCKVYVPIETNDRCITWCGDEQIIMKRGDAWRFDNLVMHGLDNNGKSDRVSLIVSMRVEA